MKSVLIIGETSYIGKSFAKYAKSRFSIKTVSSRNERWNLVSFSEYDCVLYCAGIAHVSEKAVEKQEYYRVNCDLAVDVAKKAKKDGVSQFIFISSMSVYGSTEREIDINTEPNPESIYGSSKLTAEREILKHGTDNFRICIARPPIVYGHGCKGNFPKLIKFAGITPVFPDINNKRSMIYIDNLCEFFCYAVEHSLSGVYLPQNSAYVNTTELVKLIANYRNKRVLTTKLFNPMVLFAVRFVMPVNKLFTNLTYTHSEYESCINVVGFEESIKRSVEI